MYKQSKVTSGIRLIGLLLCLVMIVLETVGCSESFRKKFVRKKKEATREEFIPVLEPVEYPAAERSAEKRYRYFYSLWKVWSTDYLTSFDEKENEKKEKYALVQVLKSLDEMKKWLKEEKQPQLNTYLEEVKKVDAMYQLASAMRNRNAMRAQYERIMNGIRRDYAPKVMEKYYIE
jgi:hypothetical protein